MEKKFYAQYDQFVESHHRKGDTPSFGFANTKAAVAFDSLQAMQTFIDRHDYDLSCHRITRKEAVKMAVKNYIGDTVLPLNDTDDKCVKFMFIRFAH